VALVETIAVDVVIAVAAMSVACVSVTAMVRVLKFASCGSTPVVTPVAIVIVHSVPAESVAVAVVNTSDAVAVPEYIAATVNDVEPHPLVVGVAGELSAQYGSTTVTVSVTTSAEFKENVNDTAEVAAVIALAYVNALCSIVASESA
jgi:hypothetical protein